MSGLQSAINYIKENDNYLILMHASPDGDTIGTACGLCGIIRKLGKKAAVACSDDIPAIYSKLTNGIDKPDFEIKNIIAADVADVKLLGSFKSYADKIGLCIDHHVSNTGYAGITYVDAESAAAAEILYDIAELLEIKIDRYIAECIYTGIATDTGCFKFSNTTARTHYIAAEMLQTGIDIGEINRRLFETKTKQAIELESLVKNTLEYYCDGKVAVITVLLSMYEKTGAKDDDIEGISAFPRQIEGVIVGITLKESEQGGFKASVRTYPPIDASEICKAFDGGGHLRAAGCRIKSDEAEAKAALVKRAKELISRQGL